MIRSGQGAAGPQKSTGNSCLSVKGPAASRDEATAASGDTGSGAQKGERALAHPLWEKLLKSRTGPDAGTSDEPEGHPWKGERRARG